MDSRSAVIKKFWEDALLRNGAQCIYHVIIPTVFASCMPSWETVDDMIVKFDEQVRQAQRYNFKCIACTKSIEGQNVTHCVRVVVSKDIIFRAGFGSGGMCNACSGKFCLHHRLNSNTEMHECMYERLENIARNLAYDTIESPEQYVNNILNVFNDDRNSFIRKVGKIDSECAHCKKSGPRKICSGCLLVRYCNADCSKSDWSLHKQECKTLRVLPFFYKSIHV